MTKSSTPTKAELHEMLAEAVAIRNPSRLTRKLSRFATFSPIPSAGLARRDRHRNARSKSKATVHLPAASGNLDNRAIPGICGWDGTQHPRRSRDRIACWPLAELPDTFGRSSDGRRQIIRFTSFDP
jgi:hypothetical protein